MRGYMPVCCIASRASPNCVPISPSVDATVSSTTILTCRTPRWGNSFVAERALFKVTFDQGLSTILSADLQDAFYEFYQVQLAAHPA